MTRTELINRAKTIRYDLEFEEQHLKKKKDLLESMERLLWNPTVTDQEILKSISDNFENIFKR